MRPFNVLLVDDNVDACELFQLALEMHGHTVVSVNDGLAAYRAIVDGTFDVALLDIGLPGMDGYEVARKARADAGDRTPRLIAMTGYGPNPDEELASGADFDAHLVKPVPVQTLLETINRVMDAR